MNKQPGKKTNEPAPPAYFSSLEVENIRCFGEKQPLDLSDGNGRPAQWTVILGDNGVGKTTLLQCLAGMEVNKKKGINYPFQPKFWYWWWNYDIGGILRKDVTTGFVRLKICVGENLSSKKSGRVVESPPVEFGVDSIGVVGFPEDMLYLNCDAYSGVRRTGASTNSQYDLGDSSISLFCDSFYFEDTLANPEEWLLQTELASLKNSESAKKMLEKVKLILVDILPDVKSIESIAEGEPHPKPRVYFETEYGKVRFKDLSLGYRTMTAWMVDLAARLFERYPDSPDPLAEPAVVLVDELDLHMHPKWQRSIIGYLTERFPNTQFIVTAHSPLVVQSAADHNANIAVLRREGDHVVIDQSREAVRGWRVDQILASELYEEVGSRSPEIEKKLAERRDILRKKEPSEKDLARLKELEQEIGYLPTAETPQDIRAMDIIHRVASHLEKKGIDKGDPNKKPRRRTADIED